MKIGIDASRYADNEATGVEWYSYHIINGLIEEAKNHDILLYSRKKLGIKGVQNKVLPAKRLWTLRTLSKEMKVNPPDVLFVPSHVLPLNLPKKSVIMIHDVAFKYLRKSYSFSQYHYLNWSTKFAVKNATKIIVPSEATGKDLVKFFKCPKEKIEVVYHGFTAPEVSDKEIDKVMKNSKVFKHFEITKDSPYILFVGRLESKKNLVRLVEAFDNFRKSHPEYRLILAGKRGVGFERLMKAVNRLKMANSVVMPGYVTEEEKAALYKYCKVFAFPSLYEGFGLPILEAFHYKKPVLSSHVSCLPEVAGDAACYIDPYDREVMTAGMERLVADKNFAKKLVHLGTERLKSFTWKKVAKQTLQIITK
ncbi:MAG: glycosyltransferase [Nitrospirae bacterium]|nr:glycosyltransferase [Nitrospirota bacterium]